MRISHLECLEELEILLAKQEPARQDNEGQGDGKAQ